MEKNTAIVQKIIGEHLDGEWLDFIRLGSKHFFERLGDGYYPQALCGLDGRESGLITREQSMKHLCKICYIQLNGAKQ